MRMLTKECCRESYHVLTMTFCVIPVLVNGGFYEFVKQYRVLGMAFERATYKPKTRKAVRGAEV